MTDRGVHTVEFPWNALVPVDVVTPSGRSDGSMLVALHGMGMSPGAFRRDVVPLLPDGTTAILPQAPLPFEIRKEGRFRQGNAWYVYLGDDEKFARDMEQVETWLLGVVRALGHMRGLDPGRISLLGFSQGGYMAGWIAMRHPARFGKLVVAGGRVKGETLGAEALAAAAAVPEFRVLHVHGAQDPSVSPESARESVEALVRAGVRAEFRTYPGGHEVLRDPGCQDDVRAFLAGSLDDRGGR